MRRRFVEAIPSDKKLHSTSVAVQAVERIKRIYHEEGLLKNCTAEERYNERQEKIKPLINEFFAWLETLPVSGKNKLAEAIGYAINEKAYLYKTRRHIFTHFLKTGMFQWTITVPKMR